MLLLVLGTAAGGGIPQWNCACPGCSGARAHPHRRRRHASLAVRTGEGRWYVVNATPDIGDQIEDRPELHPGPGPRQTPIAGVVLTDAELDHTLGIARLREADRLQVTATAPVQRPARGRIGAVLRFARLATRCFYAHLNNTNRSWRLSRIESAQPHAPNGLGRTGPRRTRPQDGDTHHVRGPFPGGRFPARPGQTDAANDGGEAPDHHSGGTGAPHAGAAPGVPDRVDHATPIGSRHRKPTSRRSHDRANLTNPLVDPAAPQHKRLARLGIEVAYDGMVIEP
ncbi:MBL fold metallo-hydrolase [Streptomyces sp. NPDC048581]|uniref:MBL fold metallo-hydrolase n=1 Tax=Streptomyces sp. NPDC048581 TaxID=3365572 RepID=UPI0037168D6E